MAKYLLNTTEVYRVENERDADALIAAAKQSNKYEVKKSISEKKEKKVKGEVVEEWYKVSITKSFNEEKDPVYGGIDVTYGEPQIPTLSFGIDPEEE